jgi:hypothetical protein
VWFVLRVPTAVVRVLVLCWVRLLFVAVVLVSGSGWGRFGVRELIWTLWALVRIRGVRGCRGRCRFVLVVCLVFVGAVDAFGGLSEVFGQFGSCVCSAFGVGTCGVSAMFELVSCGLWFASVLKEGVCLSRRELFACVCLFVSVGVCCRCVCVGIRCVWLLVESDGS